jgi:dipicolinate synthase subunit A
MKKYFVLGNDSRSVELRKIYKKKGLLSEKSDLCDVLIAPIPFSRDGVFVNGMDIKCEEVLNILSSGKISFYTGAIYPDIKENLDSREIVYYDLLESKSFTILNAIPTAEGAIQKAMELTNYTIHGSNVLVLGYGNIGMILSKMLNGIGANVFCSARKQKDIAIIEAMGYNSIETDNIDSIINNMDIVFNTIPANILDENKIKIFKQDSLYIELASKPYGMDFEIAKKYNLNVCLAPGLPSIVAPYTAAMYIKREIDMIEN